MQNAECRMQNEYRKRNLDLPTFRGRLLILFTRLPRTIRG